MNPDKRIVDMTAGEFAEVLADALRGSLSKSNGETKPDMAKQYVYGIAGIASLFNCSKTTASRIKASGKIDEAISQSGRLITVNADLARELMRKKR